MSDRADALLAEIRACRVCEAYLPAGPRPIVQFGAGARILIIGQAPGSKVHASGVPWADDSGDRLRAWTGLSTDAFYDPEQVALMPMGFCYPGKGKSGDLPPRPECAPLWHQRVLSVLPDDRLTLLVGSYAQARYLPSRPKRNMTELVQAYPAFGAKVMPLPHPAWRSVIWMRKNPWFEVDILPALRDQVRQHLTPPRLSASAIA
jgi:uracil-DNA glycosylase